MFQKEDLIKKVAQNINITKKEAEKFVNAYIRAVKDLLLDESQNGLNIQGFEKYELKKLPEREKRNPRTGEKLIKEATEKYKSTLSPKIKNIEFE